MTQFPLPPSIAAGVSGEEVHPQHSAHPGRAQHRSGVGTDTGGASDQPADILRQLSVRFQPPVTRHYIETHKLKPLLVQKLILAQHTCLHLGLCYQTHGCMKSLKSASLSLLTEGSKVALVLEQPQFCFVKLYLSLSFAYLEAAQGSGPGLTSHV